MIDNEGEDATIKPGDYIIGDLNGIVCLPAAMAEQVVDLIPSQAEADAKITEDLKNGVPFTEASKNHRAAVKKPTI